MKAVSRKTSDAPGEKNYADMDAKELTSALNTASLATLGRAELIDISGVLTQAVSDWKDQEALFKPTKDLFDAAKELIEKKYEKQPAEQAYTEDGKHYTVIVGPRSNERKIVDMPAIAERLKERFFALCSMPFKKLDVEIPPDQQTGLVTQERTGDRTIKLVRKAA